MQVFTREQLAEIANRWPDDEISYFDFETNGSTPGSRGAKIVGFSVVTGDDTPVSTPLAFSRGQNADPNILETVLTILSSRKLGAFFVPMESSWMYLHWRLRGNWVCDPFLTCLLTGHTGGLKALSEKLLGRKPIHFEDLTGGGTDFGQLDPQDERVITYMEDDVVNARDLQRKQGPLVPCAVQQIIEDELRAAVILAEDWADGIEIDEFVLDLHAKDLNKATSVIEREIWRELGGPPFTIASPVQVGKRLTALGIQSPVLTEKGNPSWSAEALEQLREAHPVVPKILEWRERFGASNAIGRARRSITAGRAYPEWFPIDAKTGHPRANCQSIPLTQLHKQVRYAFRAPSGRKWFGISWAPTSELWFMLGWVHPIVRDSLTEWDKSAAALGVTPGQLTRLAIAWALGGSSPDVTVYMAKKVPDVSREVVESVELAFARSWAVVHSNIEQALWSTFPVVTGVHTRSWPEAAEFPPPTDESNRDYIDRRRKRFLASACQMNQWSLAKKLMIDLRAAGIGYKFIPIADTLAFTSGKPVEEIKEFLGGWSHPYMPPGGPALSVGESWGDV